MTITCNNQEEILAVADNSIQDDNIIKDVLSHIASCKQCRTLYEVYFAICYNFNKKENK